MFLIAGLGNPGSQYAKTRHNAGFMFLDQLAKTSGVSFKSESRFQGYTASVNIASTKCWLLKPSTFMNRSGASVQALAHFYKISPENILVVHDELDLDCGTARLKQNGGHGGHNGLRDIIQQLGSRSFFRLRIGIDHPGNSKHVVDYVLSKMTRDDEFNIEMSIERAIQVLPLIVNGDTNEAMKTLHTRPASN